MRNSEPTTNQTRKNRLARHVLATLSIVPLFVFAVAIFPFIVIGTVYHGYQRILN